MRFSIALFPALFPALIAAPALAEPPRVVADIAPVHALLAQVMEGVADPQLLLDQTANPHSVQLKPSQARMLADADLLVWVGPELSPWLERVVEADAKQIVLMEHPATYLRPFEAAGDHDGHGEAADAEDGQDAQADDHGQEDHAEAGHDDHGHDHSGVDPHVWLTTRNARAWVGVFADALAAQDPGNAEIYRANATAAVADLEALAAGIETRLAAHRGAEIVTFHQSFGYFAEEFGLEVVGSVRPGDASAPSAAAMDELRGLIADHGVVCAYAEPAFDPGLLEAIAGGTGLRIGMLDPTGALQTPGPDHYRATMTAIADGIAECLERE